MQHQTGYHPYIRLSDEQKRAMAWCADQQVALALRLGSIGKHEAQKHHQNTQADLLCDPELLKKIVMAYRKAMAGGKVSSTRIIHEHDKLEPHEPNPSGAEPQGHGQPLNTAIAGLLALTMAGPMAPAVVQSYVTGSGAGAGQLPAPLRREHELPVHERPRVVTKRKRPADLHDFDTDAKRDSGWQR